jgi:two-component system response regulator YesN
MLNIIQDINPNELVNLLEFEIGYGYCIVAFIDSYSLMKENEQKRIYELVKHYMKNNKTCIVSPIVEGKIAIFTPIELNRDSKVQEVEIFEEVERLKEYLKKHIPNEIRFGLGSIQKGIDGWRKSYFEAVYIFKEQEEETNENRNITKQSQIIQDEVISICSAISMIYVDTSLKQFNLLFDRLAYEMRLDGKSLKTELLLLLNQIIEFLLKQNFKVERFHFPDVDELDLIKKVSEQQIIKCIQVISKEKETRLNHFVEIAKTYIHENYKEDISLVQIASYVNLNPFYFSKMFKKKTGETFSDYVMKVRIEFAKQLMLNENLNLKEISYQIGFKDPNYFSRVFKKYTNESPKSYRQKVLKLKLS